MKVAALAILVLASSVSAAELRLTEKLIQNIDALIQQRMQSQRIPGVSVALIEQGEIRYAKGFGRADPEGTPMTPQTPSSLGSISKSFAAVVVLQLMQAGLLQLDTPAADYLPQLKAAADTRVANITLHQLLNHTSGYSTYVGNLSQADFSQTPDALDQVVAALVSEPLNSNPGEQHQYSNANYQILGLLIERLTSMSFERAVQERILTPLQMHNSYVLNPGAGQTRGAQPHRFWLHVPVHFSEPPGRKMVAQGGVVTSAEDLASYLIDLHSAKPLLLQPGTRDAMFHIDEAGASPNYAMGWAVERDDSGTVISHGGSNPGYETEFGYWVEQGVGYVVLVNAGSGVAFGNVRGLIQAVKNAVLDRPEPPQTSSTSNRLSLVLTALIALALLAGTANSAVQLWRGPNAQVARVSNLIVGVLPSVALVLLAWFLWFVLPSQFGIPLSGMRAFAPDIGWLVTVSAWLALVWALCRLAVWARARTLARAAV